MKNRIVSAILALTIAFSLTACGNGEKNKENASFGRDILIVGTSRDPGLLDPNETNLQMVQAARSGVANIIEGAGPSRRSGPVAQPHGCFSVGPVRQVRRNR